MKRLHSTFWILLALGAAVPAIADERSDRIAAALPELDKMYSKLQEEQHIPGLVYGVIVDGKLVHTRSFGYANLETKQAVTSDTAFRIASMTKNFVAMAVLKLRDEGKLQLDRPASYYLPELRRLRMASKDSPQFTVKQMLTMTTGLPEDNPWGDRHMARTNAELEKIVGAGLSFSNAPNVAFEYSNLGYVLLGKIVSRQSGMRFQDYITRNILLPLGMKNTVWEYSRVPSHQLAHGYHWLNGTHQPEPILHDGDGAAMGGLITTMNDYARYLAYHINAWPASDLEEVGPLRRASLREMHQPSAFIELRTKGTEAMASFYGYGWSMRQKVSGSSTTTIVGHGGGLPGYGSQVYFMPTHKVGVVALSNLRYGPVYGLTATALTTLVDNAKLSATAIVPSPQLLERQKQAVELLQTWDQELAKQVVAENFFMDSPRDEWITLSREVLNPIGRVVSIGAIEPENRLRGKFVLQGESGKVEVFITLTPEHDARLQFMEIKLLKE